MNEIEIENDNELYELLNEIRPRPGMYLGIGSLSRLQAYMGGFFHAYNNLKVKQNPKNYILPLPFWFFHEFIKNHYGEIASTAGWCNLILSNNSNDDEKSLEVFFSLIDIYKNLTVVKCQMAEISEENNKFNLKNKLSPKYSIGNNRKLYSAIPKVNKIFIYELSNNAGYFCTIELENEIHIIMTIEKTDFEIKKFFDNLFGENLKWNIISFENVLTKKFCFSVLGPMTFHYDFSLSKLRTIKK
ncbi:MAG: hypothetical protein FWE22_07995 [Firmicutes bacterium]|nr:hypothetical protein [Bacillota bacterium]